MIFQRQAFLLIFFFFPFVAASAAFSPLILSVPFTSQAPLGEWQDERQEDGCEETVALMAMSWVRNDNARDKNEWRTQILKLSDWEKSKYGEDRDVALFDMLVWIFGDYFSHGNVAIKSVRTADDILMELEKGHLVLTPMDGQALKNPYFTPPGPERHMILIKGYDYDAGEFITNDPGTRRGENYRYSSAVIFKAIRPYTTGFHEPFPDNGKEVIVIGK
ncbi:MAG: C39 family peptidase [Patescibacteria group bacterium]|jgi:hypothetical protein